MVTPVTSLGSRSGVNWTRLWVPWMELAIALASEVFPVPGKSSSSRWPSETRQVSASLTMCCLPSTACSTLVTSAPKARANQLTCSAVIVGELVVAVVMTFYSLVLAGIAAGMSVDGDRDRVVLFPVAPDALRVKGRGAARAGVLGRAVPVVVGRSGCGPELRAVVGA